MDDKKLPDYMTDNRGIELTNIKVDPENPNTFTVSEEDAERLKAMAMANNNSEISPEIQAAMGINNQQIPDNIHNHICYDEAKKNSEKFQKESEEFTNTLVPDEATRELLDETEADMTLSKFDFGDIDEYCEKLKSLSFLEAVSHKKKIDAEIARWKSCKSMLKAISDLRLDDSVNRELMKINTMENYDFLESIDDFEANYEDNLSKLEKISNTLVSIVNQHKDEMDSTKFLTQEMIHLMKVKIDRLDPDGTNYEFNRKRMQVVVDAFEDRLDLQYLTNKLKSYLITNKSNIRRDLRTADSPRRAKFINDLARLFSEDIVYALYERLACTFNDDMKAVYILMGFLAKVMNSEKKTSRNVWAKVFILNLADIYNNIFDIEDGYVYLSKIKDEMYSSLQEFLENQKDIKIPNYRINFGVKTPVKKKKIDDIEEYSATPVNDTESSTSENVETF